MLRKISVITTMMLLLSASILLAGSANSLYVEAGKHEASGDYNRAIETYMVVVDQYPDSDVAVKAIDKINELKSKASSRTSVKPKKSVRKDSFTVYASSGWQNSNIKVNSGEKVVMTASGSWTTYDATLFKTPHFGPDGGGVTQASDTYKVMNEASLGALICKIGNSLSGYEIGKGFEFVADMNGYLFFRMNDTMIEDNGGSVTVNVEVSQFDAKEEESKFKEDVLTNFLSSVVSLPVFAYDKNAPDGWQNSKVYLSKGQRISIEANGRWTTSKGYTDRFGPDGGGMTKNESTYRLCPSAALGALIGKIGKNGRCIEIGSSNSFEAENDGFLYFNMNDTNQTDNAGELSVTIRK